MPDIRSQLCGHRYYRCPTSGQLYTEQQYDLSRLCNCCPTQARVLVLADTSDEGEQPLWTDYADVAD